MHRTKRRMQPGCRPAKTLTKYGANLAAEMVLLETIVSSLMKEGAYPKPSRFLYASVSTYSG